MKAVMWCLALAPFNELKMVSPFRRSGNHRRLGWWAEIKLQAKTVTLKIQNLDPSFVEKPDVAVWLSNTLLLLPEVWLEVSQLADACSPEYRKAFKCITNVWYSVSLTKISSEGYPWSEQLKIHDSEGGILRQSTTYVVQSRGRVGCSHAGVLAQAHCWDLPVLIMFLWSWLWFRGQKHWKEV